MACSLSSMRQSYCLLLGHRLGCPLYCVFWAAKITYPPSYDESNERNTWGEWSWFWRTQMLILSPDLVSFCTVERWRPTVQKRAVLRGGQLPPRHSHLPLLWPPDSHAQRSQLGSERLIRGRHVPPNQESPRACAPCAEENCTREGLAYNLGRRWGRAGDFRGLGWNWDVPWWPTEEKAPRRG